MICLPVIHRETSDTCIALMVGLWSRTLVIDNSPDGFARDYPCEVISAPENLGVARSWNIGRRLTLERGEPYLVVMSAATHFRDGGRSLLDALTANADPRGFQTQEGWHCLALGPPVLETVGAFDENFYPAYGEDTDFLYRMRLSGAWHPTENPLPTYTINAARFRDAHGLQLAGINVNFGAWVEYYIRKWGGSISQEVFTTPFGEDRPLDYWEPASVEEMKRRYALRSPQVPIT